MFRRRAKRREFAMLTDAVALSRPCATFVRNRWPGADEVDLEIDSRIDQILPREDPGIKY